MRTGNIHPLNLSRDDSMHHTPVNRFISANTTGRMICISGRRQGPKDLGRCVSPSYRKPTEMIMKREKQNINIPDRSRRGLTKTVRPNESLRLLRKILQQEPGTSVSYGPGKTQEITQELKH